MKKHEKNENFADSEKSKRKLETFTIGFLFTFFLTVVPFLIIVGKTPSGHQGWNYLGSFLIVIANAAVLPLVIGVICAFLRKPPAALGALSVYFSYVLLIVFLKYF